MAGKRKKSADEWEVKHQILVMNASDAESEVSYEVDECNEHSQEEVAEDANVIDEVNVSNAEVVETEIHMKDDK